MKNPISNLNKVFESRIRLGIMSALMVNESEIALGLLAGLFMNFGMLFWTIGFGVLHIVYGFVMYLKYDK